MLVGVISDTHGLLRPQAVAALEGSDLIIHAGDIGRPEVIEQLRRIAPTFAVRGKFRDRILHLNPGSAGPRRFNLPVVVARVGVEGREMRPEIVTLEV